MRRVRPVGHGHDAGAIVFEFQGVFLVVELFAVNGFPSRPIKASHVAPLQSAGVEEEGERQEDRDGGSESTMEGRKAGEGSGSRGRGGWEGLKEGGRFSESAGRGRGRGGKEDRRGQNWASATCLCDEPTLYPVEGHRLVVQRLFALLAHTLFARA